MTDSVLILAAVLPAFYLLYRIYQADHVEKEPDSGVYVSTAATIAG